MTAYLNALGVICALGRDKSEVARNLFAGDCSGMRRESGWVAERELPVAGVHGELAAIPAELIEHSSRDNQLLLEAALQIRDDINRAIQTYGRERIGVVLGTSTSASTRPAGVWRITSASSSFPANTTIASRNSVPRRISSLSGCNCAARPT